MTTTADFITFRLHNASSPDRVREHWQALVEAVLTLWVQEPHQKSRPATPNEKLDTLDRGVREVLLNRATPPDVLAAVYALPHYQAVEPSYSGLGYARLLMVKRDADILQRFVKDRLNLPDSFLDAPLPLEVLQTYLPDALTASLSRHI